MQWQQLKVNTKAEFAEQIGELLEASDAQAVTFVDAEDTPMYEPKPGEVQLWPDTQVIGLFDASHDLSPVLKQLDSLDLDRREMMYKVDQLEDKDWTRACMDDFHPMQFGERLWICPSWRRPPAPDAVNILLDPGLAFGTGTHPTTALCLRWLDGNDVAGKVITDFGCGSGILAIAALKLGASKAIAIDIDPQAILSTDSNAEKNAVSTRLSTFLPENQPNTKSEIVLANILAGPLKELKDQLLQICEEGGIIVMSGILKEQAEEVADCYAPSLKGISIDIEGDWARIVGLKSSK